jgi:hypothetical protein
LTEEEEGEQETTEEEEGEQDGMTMQHVSISSMMKG